MIDAIPLENDVSYSSGQEPQGPHTCAFYTFNTEISLSAYGEKDEVFEAFRRAISDCRQADRAFEALRNSSFHHQPWSPNDASLCERG